MNHYTIKLFYEISIRLCKEHIARHFFREKNYEINSFDHAVRLSLNGDLQNPVIYPRWSCLRNWLTASLLSMQYESLCSKNI